ncbi:hypothetical protein IscW_ISCW003534 [Ixodes scapularis]|uniref:Uncharacterized protein n=1 Tax=Ixodes scapularis TaxID=6945 RepID=B7PH48_IXOSC|nr:hypothetical protein IscW_ISCW003534 [Ixodes scapularis]|eukprot:XP_002402157.1 hypothetical protein IscW_ISCW003534 [Ixodes scapularis]
MTKATTERIWSGRPNPKCVVVCCSDRRRKQLVSQVYSFIKACSHVRHSTTWALSVSAGGSADLADALLISSAISQCWK